ncbi:MAG: LysR family transcriptional regulator [Acetatifactor sp.]
MDIRLMRYFVTVAEEGSITRAAKKLNIAQPPLSKQLRQLENELGMVLFIRGKKNIQLTEAGAFFKRRAVDLIASFDSLEKQMKNYQMNAAGAVSIGAVEAVATCYLPDILNEFHQEFPNINYEVWCGSTDDILEKLEKGLLDVGFLRTYADTDRYSSFGLLEDEWCVLIPDTHRLAGTDNQTICAQDLDGEPIIVPSTPGRIQEIESWFQSVGIKPNIVCVYNVLSMGKALAQKNLGIAMALADNRKLMEDSRHLICKKLTPALNSAVNVLWSKTHYLSDSASRLLEFISDYTQKV